MSSGRRPEHFAFFDLPRTLWYFLGEERWTFLVFSGVLLTALCYTMVPPYIVGSIANFLIDYMKSGSGARASIRPRSWLSGCCPAAYPRAVLTCAPTKPVPGAL